MLVLSRRRGEVLVIGKDVRITVLDIKSKVIRLGIDAPDDVTIHREEYQSRNQEKKVEDS